MLNTLKRYRIQIVIVLCVFALFMANAVGSFRLFLDLGPGASSLRAALGNQEFLILLVLGLTLSFLLPILSPIKASFCTLLATIPVFYFGIAPASSHSLIPMEYSLLTILMLFGVNVLASWFRESHRKQELLGVFGQYVPPELVNIISQGTERPNLEGESREMTVMFCDVHNFTSISEGLGPRQLTALLNALLTPMTRIVYKHGGTIDKYIGDALMAFWGAPLQDPEHARNALLAALEIQQMVGELASTFQSRGWPKITLGIGINSGLMNVGNMGSEYRMAYTVIGDTVNLASRLQDLTRVYHAGIIVGQATQLVVPEMLYRELDLVQVKGKKVLTRIYEPCGPADGMSTSVQQAVAQHNQALGHYFRREWDTAESLFQTLEKMPATDKQKTVYLKRIKAYRNNPPLPEWQGETRYMEK